jgi:MFS family permease
MRSYPPEKRGLALSLWAMTVISAPIFWPVMGGRTTDNVTWPWIFYINVPIGLVRRPVRSCCCVIYHHAVLAESVSVYSQNTTAFRDALTSLGMSGAWTTTAQLNGIVRQQAYMMATNDFFRISCLVFLVLAALVWITKPGKVGGPSRGH